MLNLNGKDATSSFVNTGHSQYAKTIMKSMAVGIMSSYSGSAAKASEQRRTIPQTVQPRPVEVNSTMVNVDSALTTSDFGSLGAFHPNVSLSTEPHGSLFSLPPFEPNQTPPQPSQLSSRRWPPAAGDPYRPGDSGPPQHKFQNGTGPRADPLLRPTFGAAERQAASTLPPPAARAPPLAFPSTVEEVVAFSATPPRLSSFSFGDPFHVNPAQKPAAARPGSTNPAPAGALESLLPDLADLLSPRRSAASADQPSQGQLPPSPFTAALVLCAAGVFEPSGRPARLSRCACATVDRTQSLVIFARDPKGGASLSGRAGTESPAPPFRPPSLESSEPHSGPVTVVT